MQFVYSSFYRPCLPVAFSLLLILAAHTPRLFAQDSTNDDEVIKTSTELLLFPIRIRDKRGQAVIGLKESDLSLKDKDRVTSGMYFSAGADRVALIFALDQSGSLRQIISQQREAAIALFGRFGERSSVAVIRFAEVPSVAAPFNRDLESARAAFSFPAEANRHTAIFDAAAKAVQMFAELPRVRSERHIVILISDGLDNSSRIKASAIIDEALDKRVSFYVIHLPLFEPRDGHLAVRGPSPGFRDLAEKTGGKYFLTRDARSALANDSAVNLAPIFQAIEEDLRSQYLLGFYLAESAHDGIEHRFSLSLVPDGLEYTVGRFGYSRTHKFSVNKPRTALKISN